MPHPACRVHFNLFDGGTYQVALYDGDAIAGILWADMRVLELWYVDLPPAPAPAKLLHGAATERRTRIAQVLWTCV
jgi:hypothetical protein